jgi:hypothetical protein
VDNDGDHYCCRWIDWSDAFESGGLTLGSFYQQLLLLLFLAKLTATIKLPWRRTLVQQKLFHQFLHLFDTTLQKIKY